MAPLPTCPAQAHEGWLLGEVGNLRSDYGNLYSGPSLGRLLVGVALAAVPANTSLDQEFQDGYQEDVRSWGTNRVSDVFRPLGRGQYVLPAVVGAGLLGTLCDDDACWRSHTAEWGGRSLRAILSGGPAVLLLESGLGGSRPGERPEASHWRPFDDWNGASGHAFIGAIPFLTAARMTDDRWLQGGLLLASLLPAWSRVNDDRHYLSQVGLGWWVAYLACDAVDRTAHADDRLTWTPIFSPEMAGIAMVYRR